MASKSISDFLTMPEDMQLSMIMTVQNGGIALGDISDEIEAVAADYWSGRQGSGAGNSSIFPFRRTDPTGNLYVIHRDAQLYLSLLFTGINIDFLYEYRLQGTDGEFSQELKDAVRESVVKKETTILLDGALKCEAFSKSFRGYEDLTPVTGVEVSSTNPLDGSAWFHIARRTYERIMRDEKDAWRQRERAGQDGQSTPKRRGAPAFV
jgi:hypothetical protein